jgi:hypothetical protein
MARIWRNWRLIDKVRSGTPEQVQDAFAEASSLGSENGYDVWVIERRKWAEKLLEVGELKRGETEIKTFRGYRYRIKVGNRGGMVFKSLGKAT